MTFGIGLREVTILTEFKLDEFTVELLTVAELLPVPAIVEKSGNFPLSKRTFKSGEDFTALIRAADAGDVATVVVFVTIEQVTGAVESFTIPEPSTALRRISFAVEVRVAVVVFTRVEVVGVEEEIEMELEDEVN